MSWPLVKLSDLIVEDVGGVSFKRDQFTDSGTLVIPKKAISLNVKIDHLNLVYTSNETASAYDDYKINSSFLITTLRDLVPAGPNLGRVCEIDVSEQFLLAQGVYAFRLNDLACPKFVTYYSSSPEFRKQVLRSKVGSTQVHIRSGDFKAIEIPLPPLKEQKRIAAILDKADAIRRKRQQAIKLTDDFLRSVFLDMFGDPVSNPKGWEVTSLPSHGLFKNGLNFRKGESGVSIRYLGVGDFKALTSIDDVLSLGTIEVDDFPAEDYLLQDEDLVFVRSNGNKALVGRCISVYPKNEKLTFSGFCIRYRVTDSCIEPEYLNYLLRTPSMKVAMLKGGQGANIQNINQKILSELDIPLPPKDIQGRFCDIAKAYKSVARKLDKGEDSKTILFDSVSEKAFSGKL